MASALKVAERWFERRSLGHGVTWLAEPYAHSFIRCNIWHVRGRDRDLLVDTGLGIASLRDEIADLAERPVVAVATHVHYDHAGSLHEFEDRRIHRLEVEQMADYREFAWLRRADIPEAIQQFFAELGAPIEGDHLIHAIPSPDYDPARYRVVSTPATAVDEGEVIDLGDRSFEVLHLPGHTPGSIGLWEAATGTLFSGDAVYDAAPLLDELPESDVPAYVRTMKRLRELPVEVVHAGHEPSFGRARLVEIVDEYLARRDA